METREEIVQKFERRISGLVAEYNERGAVASTTKVYFPFLYPFYFLRRQVTLYDMPGSYEGREQPFVWYGHWRTAKIASNGRVAVRAFNVVFGNDWFFVPNSILPTELMLSVINADDKPVKKRWLTEVRG